MHSRAAYLRFPAVTTLALALALALPASLHAQGPGVRPIDPTNPGVPINPGGGGAGGGGNAGGGAGGIIGGGGIIGTLPIIPGGPGGGGANANTPVIVAAQGVLTGDPVQAAVIIPSQIAANANAGDGSGATGLSYQWSVTGGRIVSATNTQAITYVADNAGSVTLNVTITSNGATATANVTAISPDTAGAITLPATAPTGAATLNASVPAATGNDRTFRWAIVGDAAIASGQNTNAITLRPGTPGLKQVTCTVRLQNLVNVELTSYLFVTGNGTPAAVTIAGGSGGGTWPGGTRLDILADPPPAGQVFDRWTGDVAAFAGANANNAAFLPLITRQTVVVPNSTPVSLTATYKSAPAWTPTTVASFNPQQQPAAQNQPAATVTTSLVHHVPPTPAGIVFLLHDNGGAATDWFQRPEQFLLARDLVAAGYGVAALNSVNRTSGTWATQTALPTNLDALNHLAAITRLVTDGAATATTPIFFLGMDEGGTSGARYADLLARGVAAQGTAPAIVARPVRGAVLYCATGNEALSVTSRVPQFFALAANDDTLGAAGLNTARNNSQLLAGRGIATNAFTHAIAPVFASRFLSLGATGTAVTAADATAIHDSLKAARLLDSNLYLRSLPTAESLRANLPAAYQPRAADVRAILAVAAGAHQFFSDANARVLNFLNGRATGAPAPAPGRLVNLSTRTSLVAVGDMFALGFNVSAAPGTSERATLLIRGIGPALRAFGLDTALAATRLEINNSSGALVAANEGWDRPAAAGATGAQLAQAAASVGAFALPAGSADAALLVQLAPGTYTVALRGVNGVIGDVLAEVYDVSRNSTRLTNLSTLANINAPGDTIVPGIVIAGNNPRTLLVRVVGPGLSAFGLGAADLLGDPRLTVFAAPVGNAQAPTVAQNNNWSQGAALGGQLAGAAGQLAGAGGQAATLTAAFPAVGAFALSANSSDAALVNALAAGAYTIRADAAPFNANPNNPAATAPNPTGRVLVEIYEVP